MGKKKDLARSSGFPGKMKNPLFRSYREAYYGEDCQEYHVSERSEKEQEEILVLVEIKDPFKKQPG